MKKDSIPLKSRIKTGLLSGVFFGVVMTIFEYFSGEVYSLKSLLFSSVLFGFIMTIVFRYQYTNENIK